MSGYDEKALSDLHFREIGKHSLLSRAQEIEAAIKAQRGSLKARNLLISSNQRFVVTVASKYSKTKVPLSDLIAEGNLGLISAIYRFDPTSGYKFASYAVWWIRQSIVKYLSENEDTIRLPRNRYDQVRRLFKSGTPYKQYVGGSIRLDPASLGDELELSEKSAIAVIDSQLRYTSISSSSYDEESSSRQFEDTTEDPLDVIVAREDLKAVLLSNVDRLDKRSRDVITGYYGLDESPPMTLSALGDHYGLTRERIRQIRDRALRKLMKSEALKELNDKS